MPVNFIKNGYKGYLEDRRPNSEGDPYQIVSRILKTINSVPKPETPHLPLKVAAKSKRQAKYSLTEIDLHRAERPRQQACL
jgi:glutamine synthetase